MGKKYKCPNGCPSDSRLNIYCKECIGPRTSGQYDYGKTPAIICMGIVVLFMGVAIIFALF